eukprot:365798-Chlamydomonas_euryale.AAC.3
MLAWSVHMPGVLPPVSVTVHPADGAPLTVQSNPDPNTKPSMQSVRSPTRRDPPTHRNDAGLAAAELALAVEAATLGTGDPNTVGTTGKVLISPGAVNSVPRDAVLGIGARGERAVWGVGCGVWGVGCGALASPAKCSSRRVL